MMCVRIALFVLSAAVEALSGDWQVGTATFYGDGGSGGACGGSDLGDYGTGDSWIDGLYVATSSWMFCGSGDGSCGSEHAHDCGRCYEVRCTGTDTNTDGYEPCTSSTVTVAVTDECPDSGHCGGQKNHLDLSTKAFNVIGNEKAGVIHVEFRQVACTPGVNAKLAIKAGSSQWHLEVAAKDIAGVGSVQSLEVKTEQLGQWTTLNGIYGQFWQYAGDMGEGPYEFRLTAEDGKVLTYKTSGAALPVGDIDLGKNIQDSTPIPAPTPATTPAPTPATTPAPTPAATPAEGTEETDETEETEVTDAPTPALTPAPIPASTPAPSPAPSPELTPTPAPTPTLATTPTPGSSQAGAWAQCGGVDYDGPTQCTLGYECEKESEWYSQCVPSSSSPSSSEAGAWDQCGGSDWEGPTECILGYVCDKQSDWYSQCKPSSSSLLRRRRNIVFHEALAPQRLRR